MTRQQQINSEKQLAVIMKHFDFDKVYQYMVDTDWKWYRDIEGEGTIPTLRQLRKRAKYLLTCLLYTSLVHLVKIEVLHDDCELLL